MYHNDRRWTLWAVILALLAARNATTVIAKLHEHLSFDPPFLDVDHFGKRTVGFAWDLSGSTKAMRNFVRLTPDQQSKQGSLWSVDAIGSTVFTSVLEFRISGKGDRFFGDGLALWIVEPEHKHDMDDHHYMEYYGDDFDGGWGRGLKDLRGDLPSGDYHGFVEQFKGVGVIVDTYRNEEFYSSHKDVTVVYNTGNMTRAEMMEMSVGCNAQVRYYESRDDFDPGSLSSRLKVEHSGNLLTIKVDPKHSNTWTDCAEIELPQEMGEEWTKSGHLGVTSSTGELSDNHDVIRLDTYVNSEAAVTGEMKRENKEAVEVDPNIPFLERLTNMETTMNVMLVKMELMDVHQEHNVAKVEEHVKDLFDKTTANEKGLADSLETLELKVRELEIKLRKNLENTLDMEMEKTRSESQRWRIPFMLLLLGVATGAIASYKVYLSLRKSHLL